MQSLSEVLAGALQHRRAPLDEAAEIPTIKGHSAPNGLRALLSVADGFTTKSHVFRVFGTEGDSTLPSLSEWNAKEWWSSYPVEDVLLFGEDLFGDQYGYRFEEKAKTLVRVRCEGGEVEAIEGGINGFIEALLDPSRIVDMDLATRAFKKKLQPTPGQHLAFKLPLVMGGEESLANLHVESIALHFGVLGQV